jgi:Heterokaryon incompatibility protein (HET)
MEAPPSDLGYKPLEGSEIRLVRFRDTHSPLEVETISLELRHFKPSNQPRYLALSYVWGNVNDTRPVQLNSVTFEITVNLLDALQHIREEWPLFEEDIGRQYRAGPVEVWLWIDAICINQRDLDEKARQIPRMGEIYGMAHSTLIWLGTAKTCNLDASRFRFLIAALKDFKEAEEQITGQPALDVDEDLITLVVGYWRLLEAPWFWRIWVIQEYARSRRDPLVLLGNQRLQLRSIFDFCRNLQLLISDHQLSISNDQRTYYIQSLEVARAKAFGPEYMTELWNSEKWQEKSLADQLRWCTQLMRAKNSTVPHDRIYGLLGMFKVTQLTDDLLPDYQQPYALVCRRYTRYLIEQAQDLGILMFDKPMNVEGEQSWVMDFRWNRIFLDDPITRHKGFFSSNGEELIVDGAMCIDVHLLFFTTGDQLEKVLQDFYNKLIKAAAKMWRLPAPEVWKMWFRDFFRNESDLSHHLSDSATLSAEAFLDSTLPGRSDHRDYGSMLKVADYRFPGCTFVLTEDGEIWSANCRALTDSAAKVQVWALRGSSSLSILSRDAAGKYRYLGWVRGNVAELDEKLFSKHKLERIAVQ